MAKALQRKPEQGVFHADILKIPRPGTPRRGQGPRRNNSRKTCFKKWALSKKIDFLPAFETRSLRWANPGATPRGTKTVSISKGVKWSGGFLGRKRDFASFLALLSLKVTAFSHLTWTPNWLHLIDSVVLNIASEVWECGVNICYLRHEEQWYLRRA